MNHTINTSLAQLSHQLISSETICWAQTSSKLLGLSNSLKSSSWASSLFNILHRMQNWFWPADHLPPNINNSLDILDDPRCPAQSNQTTKSPKRSSLSTHILFACLVTGSRAALLPVTSPVKAALMHTFYTFPFYVFLAIFLRPSNSQLLHH